MQSEFSSIQIEELFQNIQLKMLKTNEKINCSTENRIQKCHIDVNSLSLRRAVASAGVCIAIVRMVELSNLPDLLSYQVRIVVVFIVNERFENTSFNNNTDIWRSTEIKTCILL